MVPVLYNPTAALGLQIVKRYDDFGRSLRSSLVRWLALGYAPLLACLVGVALLVPLSWPIVKTRVQLALYLVVLSLLVFGVLSVMSKVEKTKSMRQSRSEASLLPASWVSPMSKSDG